jgi:hypothetical protein
MDTLVESAPAEVADPEALISFYRDAHERWFEILTEDLGFDASAKSWGEFVSQNDSAPADYSSWASLLGESIPASNN